MQSSSAYFAPVQDLTPPVLESGTIDYNDGTITITAPETIDVTLNSADNFAQLVDLTKSSLSKISHADTFLPLI